MLIALCLVLFGAAAAGYLYYDSTRPSAGVTAAQAAASCAGKSYLGAQPDNDVCADADGSLTIAGLEITAAPLHIPDGGTPVSLCTKVSLINERTEEQTYSNDYFKIQRPNGSIPDKSTSQPGSTIESGTIVPSGTRNLRLCSQYRGAKGQYVLIYQAAQTGAVRGIWTTVIN